MKTTEKKLLSIILNCKQEEVDFIIDLLNRFEVPAKVINWKNNSEIRTLIPNIFHVAIDNAGFDVNKFKTEIVISTIDITKSHLCIDGFKVNNLTELKEITELLKP